MKLLMFLFPELFYKQIYQYLLLHAFKRTRGLFTMIPKKTMYDSLTYVGGSYFFWYNLQNNSTMVAQFKTWKWYYLHLKLILKKYA